MKFKYNHKANMCWYKQDIVNPQQEFTTSYNAQGFRLEENNSSHWITFTIYPNTIRAFYKYPQDNNRFVYYRKDLPKQEEIEWEFTYLDQIRKDWDSKWKFINK